MPNSIELPKGYENVLMEAYRKESLTAVLESAAPQGNIAQMEQLGRVLLPRLLHGRPGRRAGQRATAAEQRRVPDLEAHQRQLRPRHHPGNRPESGRPVLQPGVRQRRRALQPHQVVPEGDAFVFSTLCAGTGITKEQKTYADGADMLKGLNAAMCDMDEKEVPEEGRVLFITPTLLGMVKDLDTTKSREALDASPPS